MQGADGDACLAL